MLEKNVLSLQIVFSVFVESINLCFTTGASDQEEFRTLRNQVVVDALTFHKLVVPIAQEVLSQARELFDYFTDPSENADIFLERIDMFIEDTSNVADSFLYLKDLHEPLVVRAQQRSNEADVVTKALGKLSKEYKEKLQEIENKQKSIQEVMDTRIYQPCVLAFDPAVEGLIKIVDGVKNIICQALLSINNHDKKTQENLVEITSEALNSIVNYILPALQKYLQILENLRRIFSGYHIEAKRLAEQAQKAKDSESRKRLDFFYSRVSKKAHNIQAAFMNLLTFYDIADTKFQAMVITKDNEENWVSLYEQIYERDKELCESLKNVKKKGKLAIENPTIKVPEVTDLLNELKIEQLMHVKIDKIQDPLDSLFKNVIQKNKH
eukprot:403343263